MPLKRDKSKFIIKYNIRKLITQKNYPQRQAIAIAMSKAGKSRKKSKKK